MGRASTRKAERLSARPRPEVAGVLDRVQSYKDACEVALGDRCWAMLDAKMERSRGVQWPQWCPLPAGAVYWMAQKATANREFERSVYESLAPMIHAIALWRYGQGVYRFDDHLAAELLDTPLSSGLPAEVLTRLPEWCPLIVAPRCEGWPA